MIKFLNNNENELLKVFKIYTEAFPLSEQIPIEMLHQRIKNKRENVLGYYQNCSDDKEHLIGFATLFSLQHFDKKEKYNFTVLNYFAIDNNYRGKNYGYLFLEEVINTIISNNTILIIEIENPYNSDPSSVEYKRLLFYRKINCVEYPDFAYNMPSFSDNNKIEMKLLSVIGKNKDLNQQNNIVLSHFILDEIKLAIYKQMYNLDESRIKELT